MDVSAEFICLSLYFPALTLLIISFVLFAAYIVAATLKLGEMPDGVTQQEALRRLIDKVLSTANGEHLKHEQAGFKELAIFKSGVTL